MCLFGCVLVFQSCLTLSDPIDCIACQAPLSMEFSRQEYWSGLPVPPPVDLPNPGIEPGSPWLKLGQSKWETLPYFEDVCNGLNVYVSLQPLPYLTPYSYVEILTLQCDGFKRWDLWEVARSWKWSPHNGISPFEGPRGAHQERGCSPKPFCAGILISNFRLQNGEKYIASFSYCSVCETLL